MQMVGHETSKIVDIYKIIMMNLFQFTDFSWSVRESYVWWNISANANNHALKLKACSQLFLLVCLFFAYILILEE